MLDFRLVPRIRPGLDARPLNREPVSVESRFCKEPDVLLVAVIMVHRLARRLHERGMFDVLLHPVITVDIVALHLMRGRRGPYHETL